jgi:Zn-dependent protease with chaperone function
VAQPATLHQAGENLRITTAAATLHWQVADLRVVSEPDRLPLRLAPESGDARLEIAEPEAAAQVAALLAGSAARGQARRRSTGRAAGLALGIVLLLAGAVAGWPFLADALARALPLSFEAQLGTAVEQKLFSEARRCDRPDGLAALERLTAKLLPHAGAPMPLTVTVLDLPAVNAAAMPGGRIVLFRGLLREAVTAEEVAGVLAHEMAHAAQRHALRGVVRGLGLSVLGALVGGPGGLAEYAATFAVLSHSRAFEREADARAATMLRAAGIGTVGLADFFARMEARHGATPGLLDYVATHPPSAERRDALPKVQAAQPLSLGEWQALRAICNR